MTDFDPYYQWLGIPLQEQPASHYRLLGIPEFDGNVDIIKAAAERQTIYLRTLQAGEHAGLVTELLNEVSQARVCLLNADQKAEYDEQLRKHQTPEPVREPTPPPIPVVQTPAPLRNIPPPTPAGDWEPVAQNRPQAMTAEWSTFQTVKEPQIKAQKPNWKRPAVIGISVVGVIGILVLFISMMFSGDADLVASNTAGRISAEMAVEKAAVEKAAVVTAALDKGDWKAVLSLYPDNREGLRMQAIAEKAAAEKAAAEKAAADKAAADKAAMDKVAAEKAAADKAAADKAAMVKAELDAAREKAAEKAAADKAAAAAKRKAAEILPMVPAPNNSDLSGLWRNYKTGTTFRYKQKGNVLTVELEGSETMSFFSASFRITRDRLVSTAYSCKIKGDPRGTLYRRSATGRIVDDSSIEMRYPFIFINRDGSIRSQGWQTATYLRVE